jgi:SPP1 gp7 family putative phage head morphogenesis protein
MMLASHNGKLCSCMHKGAKVTGVGKYVETRQAKLAKKLVALLASHAKTIAEQAAKIYGKKMQKGDDTDALVQSILDELGVSELSVNVVDSLTPEMIRAFQQAGILGLAQVSFTADGEVKAHLDQKALDYADARAAELVVGLDVTTTESLRSIIADAIENGDSSADLSKSIQEAGAFSEARANTIARTELATAHVQGNVQGWKETGLVDKKEWIMGDLHDIEDDCDLNAADGPIGVDEEFSSGDLFPPAHPNCICDVLPVLAANQGDEE